MEERIDARRSYSHNLKTGEIEDYEKDKVPSWVDQIYTTEIAEEYNTYYGKYKNGFLNSIIGKKEVQVPTGVQR